MKNVNRKLRIATVIALLALSIGCAQAPGSLELELEAGKYDRQNTPVYWELPAAQADGDAFRLLRLDGESETAVPVQKVDGKLVWILREPLAAGATRKYRLHFEKGTSASQNLVCVNDGKGVEFSLGSRRILRYQHATQLADAPERVPEERRQFFARSGYIHPVWNPSGQLVTNDFPDNHFHHHGIWFPWTKSDYEGRVIDFWNAGKGEGTVEFVSFDSYGGGAVLGHLLARQAHVDLKAPGGKKTVLAETWNLRVYALDDGFLFDLESRQTGASGSPLKIRKNHYSALGFRGSEQWEGESCVFTTSEGKNRDNGHETRARWCDIGGPVDGKPTGVTIFCHPGNFRFPQGMRIHPAEPFFSYTPTQQGPFEIKPGETYVSRFRFHVHDGPVDSARTERLWQDYADPPRVLKRR